MTEFRTPYPVPGVIWASLPLPAFLVDIDLLITEANPAAEIFLNASVKTLRGQPALDRLHIDAPMEEAFARARANQSPLFINDVDVTSGERAPMQCNVQIAPMLDNPGVAMLLISPREIADRLGRSMSVKSSARSAIGMAEMLAHEIKNPAGGHFRGGTIAVDGAVCARPRNDRPDCRRNPAHREAAGTGRTVWQSAGT